LVLLILLIASAALAQQLPSYEVKRATSKIEADGSLDDAPWQSANTLTLMFPWEQQTGAKQKTTARLLWDNEYLYVGYDCEDTDIVALYQNRDDPTYKDDAVEIFINPRPSQQQVYYGLEMNANAVLYDYLRASPAVLVKRFDLNGVKLGTRVRGSLNRRGDTDKGWSLEIAIPWHNFEDMAQKLPPEPGISWAVNVNRWDGVEPDRRLSVWSDPALKQPNPHAPSRFGTITFR
jgi:hypothetical protein